MKDTLKYLCSIVKDENKKICKDWVDYMLYGKSHDDDKVIGLPYYDGGQRIRVIGSVVTRY